MFTLPNKATGKIFTTIFLLAIFLFSQNTVFAATTGQIFPTLGTSVSESPWSDNAWVTPENIYTDNGVTANVTASQYDTGDQTRVLKATGFDFSVIPDSSTINGITARINSFYRSGAGSGSMDLCQLLDVSRVKVGTNQCSTVVPLTTDTATIITKGGTSDTWGNALTTAWVKDADFGIAIGILATATDADVDVDYVTLEIDYTAPNTAPTLSISQPDGVSDSVTVGASYNITYSLADTEQVVTAAFYYDTDNSGLDGTAITGVCASATEGTNATCSWNTTGVTPGTYYVYGLTSDGIAAQVSAYSSGTITINAPADTTAPTPNPMTFASTPANDSSSQISMTSTTGSDATTPVNYLFTNDNSSCGASAGTGGTSSSYQTSTTYSDSGLQPNKCYGYTVTARDSVTPTPNTGTASSISSTYTSANTPSTPTLTAATASTLRLTNAENSNPASNPTTNFAVQVVTTSPSDATWLNKWVNASGAPSATAVWMTDAQLDALVLQGLQPSTLYGVKVKARNQDTDETALSAEVQGTTSSTPTTTLAAGTDPATATVAPESGIRDAGAFTFVTNTGVDTVTGLTVTLAGSGTPYAGLSEARITSDNGGTTYFTALTSFSGNSVSFSGGVSIPVSSGTPAQFKIRLTPFSHSGMPVPLGANYDFTAYVSAFTSTNSKVTSDSNANTLTIDNLSPSATTGAGISAGDAQATVSWTNPLDADFSNLIVLRDTATILTASTPTEGTSPIVGSSCGGTACQVRYISSGTSFLDTGLSNSTTYFYRIYAKDTHGNYTAFASTQQVSGTPTATPTTTLGTGTDPASTTIAPGASETDVNQFTLQTNTGTESVTSITVNLSTNSGVGLLALTNDANATIGSVSSPVAGSNTISVNISANTSATTYKVRVTPHSHAGMPSPAGGAYSITAPVTTWVGSYAHTGTDTNTNALTIDNLSPGNVPSASVTAGDTQVSVSWTNPSDTDFTTDGTVLVLRNTSSVTDTPTEGATYTLGGSVGSSVAACVVSGTPPSTSCTDAGRTNGTAYHYKIFTRDSRGNYSATGVVPLNSPATPSAIVLPTYAITASAGTGGTVLPAGVTNVTQGNSQAYTITPNSGYEIETLTIDGATTTPVSTYTFTNVQTAHTISATFVALSGTETITAGPILASITFDGKAFMGGAVSIIHRELDTEIVAAQQDVSKIDGSFHIRFVDLPKAIHSFGLLVKDPEGRTSQTKFFLVDANATNPVFQNIVVPPTVDVLSGQVSRGSSIRVFGYASPSHTVRLYLDDILVNEALAGRGGVYSFNLPTGALEFGQHKIIAKQINLDGGKESDFSTSKTFIVSKLAVVKADFSGDGKVNITDWSIFISRFFSKNLEAKRSIDLTGDGVTDISDFSIFIRTVRQVK